MTVVFSFKSKRKYNNIKVDGYDSKKESYRGLELERLQKEGKIRDLKKQPRFLLQDSFTHRGIKYRAIEYVADFSYYIDEKFYVDDTKSNFTSKLPIYSLKKKLLLTKYPDIYFVES